MVMQPVKATNRSNGNRTRGRRNARMRGSVPQVDVQVLRQGKVIRTGISVGERPVFHVQPGKAETVNGRELTEMGSPCFHVLRRSKWTHYCALSGLENTRTVWPMGQDPSLCNFVLSGLFRPDTSYSPTMFISRIGSIRAHRTTKRRTPPFPAGFFEKEVRMISAPRAHGRSVALVRW